MCIAKDVLARCILSILNGIEDKRQDRKEARVHGEPVCPSEQAFPFHLRCDMNDIARYAYAGSGASICSFVSCQGLSRWGRVVQERAIEDNLNMPVRQAQKLLDPGGR